MRGTFVLLTTSLKLAASISTISDNGWSCSNQLEYAINFLRGNETYLAVAAAVVAVVAAAAAVVVIADPLAVVAVVIVTETETVIVIVLAETE